MSSRKCTNCCFGDKCHSNQVCDDYAPIIDEPTDEEIAEMIEAERDAFYDAWIEYISEYEN